MKCMLSWTDLLSIETPLLHPASTKLKHVLYPIGQAWFVIIEEVRCDEILTEENRALVVMMSGVPSRERPVFFLGIYLSGSTACRSSWRN